MLIQTLSPFTFSELEREVTSSEPGRSSTHMVQTPLFITARKVVAARLCFRRRLSFCSQRSCVYPSMHWGRHLLGRPPGRQPPPGRHPPGQTPHPLGGHCSGRYASYGMHSCFCICLDFEKK